MKLKVKEKKKDNYGEMMNIKTVMCINIFKRKVKLGHVIAAVSSHWKRCVSLFLFLCFFFLFLFICFWDKGKGNKYYNNNNKLIRNSMHLRAMILCPTCTLFLFFFLFFSHSKFKIKSFLTYLNFRIGSLNLHNYIKFHHSWIQFLIIIESLEAFNYLDNVKVTFWQFFIPNNPNKIYR